MSDEGQVNVPILPAREILDPPIFIGLISDVRGTGVTVEAEVDLPPEPSDEVDRPRHSAASRELAAAVARHGLVPEDLPVWHVVIDADGWRTGLLRQKCRRT